MNKNRTETWEEILNSAGLYPAKANGHDFKEQAIESGRNLVADAIIGNDLKEGLNREKIALR